MIRPKKKQPQDLQSLQLDVIEIDKCKKDPVYFYNTYIRKEGQKVLTQEEFEEYEAVVKKNRGVALKDRSKDILMYPDGSCIIVKEVAKDSAKGKDLDNIIISTE